MATVLIGIDDTDNDESPGTGQLARRLIAELASRGAQPLGITRHQFLVDPRIPYTSHNSGACLAIGWDGALAQLQVAADLIAAWAADGSDPGICICEMDRVPDEVCRWGYAAAREVLKTEDALALAAAHGLQLAALGGTGQGVVGALASVGQRAKGEEGRFLDLPGLRELNDRVTAGELSRLGVGVEHTGPPRTNVDRYETLGWVRPRLAGGKAIWPVEWSDEHDAWVPVDRRRSRPLE